MSWSISSIECGEIPSSLIPGMSDADVHQFHLIPRDWRAGQHFSHPSQCVPSGERHWNQYGFNAGSTRDGSKKFLVRLHARATALEHYRAGLRPQQHLGISSWRCLARRAIASVVCGLEREREGYRANARPQSKLLFSKNRGPDPRVEFCATPPEILAYVAPVFRQLGSLLIVMHALQLR
jgi:hypothetical protein